jgi:uncharacterized protein YkwD
MKRIFKGLFLLSILTCCITTYGQQLPNSKKEFKREFLESINHTREKGCTCGVTYMPPAGPLVWNDELETAATGHAKDMAVLNYFSHTSRDGRTMGDRIAAAGYNFKGYKSFMIGENIAAGQQSIAEVMQGWIKSEGHCKNLMNPKFKEVGVAYYKNFWVQDFGGRQPFSTEEERLIKSGKARIIEN